MAQVQRPRRNDLRRDRRRTAQHDHADWAEGFLKRHPEFNADNAEDIIKFEIGQVFAQVLECAGVYKPTPEGREHLHKFLDCVREG